MIVEKWPNFFIVGSPKSGTSSLYAYLNEIPGIYMSPIKEPNYFSRNTFPDDHSINPIRDTKKYLELFRDVMEEKIIGEASPTYLADPDAPKLIHGVSPNAKILISLREPVERTFSNYLMLVRIGVLKSSFHEELQKSFNDQEDKIQNKLILKRGLYYENVKKYLNIFSTKNVKIIIFEEFIKNEKKTIEDILKFLDLDSKIIDFKPEIFNKFGMVRGRFGKFLLQNRRVRRVSEKLISPEVRNKLKEKIILKNTTKPKIEQEDRQILIEFFYDDVQKLKELLGHSLPWKYF